MRATPSKTTTALMTGKAAVAMVRHPTLRRATVKAAKPPAKVGWRVGKVLVARKARGQAGKARGQMDKARHQIGKAGEQLERVGAAGRTLGSIILVYGPMAAEVFGVVEKPTPKRRVPGFAAGLAIGVGAGYVLNRQKSA
ncbi:MAG: hypothetical protein JO262_12910 [Solirubrobacterales bacterium]|nr:hypothetical protein [Solirubrobacterales bacterium]